jgi:hypothetical protein
MVFPSLGFYGFFQHVGLCLAVNIPVGRDPEEYMRVLEPLGDVKQVGVDFLGTQSMVTSGSLGLAIYLGYVGQ